MWQFTRLSGLFLVLLAAIGFTYALLLGARTQIDLPTLLRWTFFPNPNHVVNYVADVEAGWMNAGLQVLQMAIIFFGITHGFNGLRMILEDYIERGFGQMIMRGFIFLLWLVVFIVAIQVILAN
jgi:succinate dehydrogenase hydrophobic anchor subunit